MGKKDSQAKDRYVVCYDKKIVDIWFEWNPTEEEIKRAVDICFDK